MVYRYVSKNYFQLGFVWMLVANMFKTVVFDTFADEDAIKSVVSHLFMPFCIFAHGFPSKVALLKSNYV